ncbi:MAG TPA: type II toxin-antitoxin system RelE/ParE family toxin [Spirochaetota bacterium]|jgi:mRNA interferase RelE/StbE|nr:type II toxin-antitoxin system RelE/ParE family toxin [Spirochaetota bacterium]HQP49810.1 type II toxin-antitoxin system RelE/ParE family toxin [Spirochaetota bacterium]
MKYEIEFKPRALKDLKSIDKKDVKLIIGKIEEMKSGIDKANIKKLTNFTPEYRLRVGNYRILFEITDNIITIYTISHRKDAYR